MPLHFRNISKTMNIKLNSKVENTFLVLLLHYIISRFWWKFNHYLSRTSVTACIDAPCFSSSSITFTLFFLQAIWRGVKPFCEHKHALLDWDTTTPTFIRSENPQKLPFSWMNPWHSVIMLCDLVHLIYFKPQIKLFLRFRFIFKLSSECLSITMATRTTVYCGVRD